MSVAILIVQRSQLTLLSAIEGSAPNEAKASAKSLPPSKFLSHTKHNGVLPNLFLASRLAPFATNGCSNAARPYVVTRCKSVELHWRYAIQIVTLVVIIYIDPLTYFPPGASLTNSSSTMAMANLSPSLFCCLIDILNTSYFSLIFTFVS